MSGFQIPRTLEEYNSPEVQEHLRKARAYEASVKPFAEREWRQYQRGLTTFWELIAALTEIDVQVKAHTQRVRDLQEAGWTINPELVDHVRHQHARLLRTRTDGACEACKRTSEYAATDADRMHILKRCADGHCGSAWPGY